MVIDGTDPAAAAKPEGRLIKPLVRGSRFNATLGRSDSVPFAALAKCEGVSPSYFTRVVRLSYLAPDITQAILDGRQPRDLWHLIDLIWAIFHPMRRRQPVAVRYGRRVEQRNAGRTRDSAAESRRYSGNRAASLAPRGSPSSGALWLSSVSYRGSAGQTSTRDNTRLSSGQKTGASDASTRSSGPGYMPKEC
jgi:hypothetical protein